MTSKCPTISTATIPPTSRRRRSVRWSSGVSWEGSRGRDSTIGATRNSSSPSSPSPGRSSQMGSGLTFQILFVSACDDADPRMCVMKHCTLQTVMCMFDRNCSNWIQCVEGCEENDKISCPTFCVMYYSSPVIDAFIRCAMDDFGCYIEDYSGYPDCTVPDGERLDLAGMHGSWWLTRVHNNETSMFEFPCQNFSFEEHSSERLSLDFTVPLEHDGEWRVPVTETDFQWRSDGSILVDYPAWSNYTEDWHLLHKTENALVAHVCFESYEDYKNYGKLVLSRMRPDPGPPVERREQAMFFTTRSASPISQRWR